MCRMVAENLGVAILPQTILTSYMSFLRLACHQARLAPNWQEQWRGFSRHRDGRKGKFAAIARQFDYQFIRSRTGRATKTASASGNSIRDRAPIPSASG